MFDSIKDFFPAVHKEGYVFIVIAFAVTTLCFALNFNTIGWLCMILSVWCVYFFRDPERVTPIADGAIISPADGIIQKITRALPPKELGMENVEMLRISVFLNVFNVHVNRIAIDGTIHKAHYHHGKFLNASLDKASEDNERQALWIKTKNNQDVALVQIAGLIARRIVCYAKENDQVKAGERFGIIRFGSRADIYLPLDAITFVAEGQTVIGGETILAMIDKKTELKINKWEIR